MNDTTGNETLYESDQHARWHNLNALGAGMEFSQMLGRRARTGDWKEQSIATYTRIGECLDAGQFDDASALADYFVDEAQVCYGLYRQWLPDLCRFLSEHGVSTDDIAEANRRILATLDLPDGRPFIAKRCWTEFLDQVRRFHVLCGAGDTVRARAMLDTFKESWRRIHDRDVDHCYGLMNEVKVRVGEPAVEDMLRSVLLPLFTWRYSKFDIDKHPWDQGLETLLYVACEAMRGHLSGPRRDGNFELIEEPERWVVRFDPCGSGGRSVRGDTIEGTGPRMDPPYNYAVTEEKYDWAWNKKGVCYYCAHCCVLMEQMPIDRFGYPVRVVEPPLYPNERDAKCTWYMYKDPTKVPAEYYERVGRTKPAAFGSSHHSL
jgi:hypothetical protein